MKRFEIYWRGNYVNARTSVYNAERYIKALRENGLWETKDFIVWTTEADGSPIKFRVDINGTLVDYSYVEFKIIS